MLTAEDCDSLLEILLQVRRGVGAPEPAASLLQAALVSFAASGDEAELVDALLRLLNQQAYLRVLSQASSAVDALRTGTGAASPPLRSAAAGSATRKRTQPLSESELRGSPEASPHGPRDHREALGQPSPAERATATSTLTNEDEDTVQEIVARMAQSDEVCLR